MSEAIKENIRRLLDLTGATHQQLADIAGVDRSSISHWKSGRADPRRSNLQRIADHYGISVENLTSPNGMKFIVRGRGDMLRDESVDRLNRLEGLQDEIKDDPRFSQLLVVSKAALNAAASGEALTGDERELVSMFRKLNDDGRNSVLNTVAAFLNSGMYKRDE